MPICLLSPLPVLLAQYIGFIAGAVAAQDPPGELVKPKPVPEIPGACEGVVVDAGKDWVVVRPDGRGALKRIDFGGFVENGRRRLAPVSDSYRAEQIQVGDRVVVHYFQRGPVAWADLALIRRRPGGRVPVQPQTALPDWPWAHHNLMNMFQDWEERGLAFPPEHVEFADDPPSRLSRPYPRGLLRGPMPRVVNPK